MGGTVTVNDSPVTGNTAGTDGGGIYVFNDPSADEEVTLRDSEVSHLITVARSVPGCSG